MSGMLALIAAGPEELESLTKSLEDSDGAAKDMATTMQDNTKGAWDEFTSALEGAGIAIGKVVLPALTNLLNGVTDVISGFNSLDEGTQKIIITAGLVVGAIGPLLIIGGKVISGIGAISTAISGVGGLLGALGGPVGWVALAVVAIAGLVTAFDGLNNELDSNESELEKAGDNFESFTGRVRTNRSIWTGIFGENIEIKFSDNFEEVREGIQGEIDGLLSDIQNYYDNKNQMEESEREAALQGITAKQLEQRNTLNDHLQTNLNSLSEYFMKEQGLTSQETAEQQQQYAEFYEAQETRFTENQNAINEIYRTKSEEKREFTAGEQAEIQRMSEENAGIMTALTTSNIDDMLSAWKAYYEANTKLLQVNKEQQNLYATDVQSAYIGLTTSIHDNFAEQEKAVRNNTSLNKEQQDKIIANLRVREEAETNFTSIYGGLVQQQILGGQNYANANALSFRQIVTDINSGKLKVEEYGMSSVEYMAMAIVSMANAGASADDLTAAIKEIPEDKRAEVLAKIEGKSDADSLKQSIDNIKNKTVYVNTIFGQTGGLANVNYTYKNGVAVPSKATGGENLLAGITEVAEYGAELIQSRSGALTLATGRQFYNMEGGETVYNARQTREILTDMDNRGVDNTGGFILLAEKIETLTKVTDSLKTNLNNIASKVEEKEFNGDLFLDTEKVGEAVYPTVSNRLANGRSFAR